MRQGSEEPSLAFLIERSAELKPDLVRFAQARASSGGWYLPCWRPPIPTAS